MSDQPEDRDTQYQRARLAAMNYLARREHARAELQSKLTRRFDTRVVELALDSLAAEGLQSDQRFVESFVTSHMSRGQGPVKIAHELRRKGVASELVENELNRHSDRWLQLALETLARKFGDVPPSDSQERQRRQRFIAGRGFPNEICYRLFD